MRQEPIPPPSEPMQFRAIGLVKGRYTASEEQLTRGLLTTTDGCEIPTVLLGRVMSLVKKYLNLAEEHLWVVYPRTVDKTGELYLQIVGIWEPETLQQPDSEMLGDGDEVQDSEPELKAVPPKQLQSPSSEPIDGYFSIRGEVVFQSADKSQIAVKIKQAPRKNQDRPRSFKLQLQGQLDGRVLHQFWDLKVFREAEALVIKEANYIGILPPKKSAFKSRKRGQGPGRGSRFPSGKRDYKSGPPKPRPSTGAQPTKRLGSPVPRPVKVKQVVQPSHQAESGNPSAPTNNGGTESKDGMV